MMLTSLHEYFSATLVLAECCMAVCLTQLLSMAIFRAKTFHKVVQWHLWGVLGCLIIALSVIYC